MASVLRRLERKGFQGLTQEQKKEIGRLVNDCWRNAGIKFFLQKITTQEAHGPCQVFMYPKVFTPQIDKIIDLYTAHRGLIPSKKIKHLPEKPPSSTPVQTTQSTLRTPRKRIPLRSGKPLQPAFSAKPKQ